MIVQVTAADIARGIRHECRQCPIALALNRARPDLAPWHVTNTSATACTGRKWLLPVDAEYWTFAFDDGLTVEPFSFALEIA